MLKRLFAISIFCVSLMFSSPQVRASGQTLEEYLYTVGTLALIHYASMDREEQEEGNRSQAEKEEEFDPVGWSFNWVSRKIWGEDPLEAD